MRLDDRFRWLAGISLSEIGTMLVFSNYSALLPILQKEWSLTNGQAGWIYSSYQIGYILSVVSITSLTDYRNPKSIYILSAQCFVGRDLRDFILPLGGRIPIGIGSENPDGDRFGRHLYARAPHGF